MTGVREINFDGLVGPTHNYAGLSGDNVASVASRESVSNPRAAALEGLSKMRTLLSLGVEQAILPPHERPHIPTLRQLGFAGDDASVLRLSGRDAPRLLAMCSSASSMWAANAATVSPSSDSSDGRVHVTPANLVAHGHRAIETATTHRVLRRIFSDERHFVVHDPLPATTALADEGAANHVRLGAVDTPGVHLMVYGRDDDHVNADGPMPRQTLLAAQAITRLHGTTGRTVFALQHSTAVRAGAFHNDVVAVGRGDVLLCHEHAYADQQAVLATIGRMLEATGVSFRPIVVAQSQVPLADAVRSYLFNGQLVSDRDGHLTLVVPTECRQVASVARWLDHAQADPAVPIDRVVDVDVRGSMRNGGGPACLRLCVALAADEHPHGGVMATSQRLATIEAWVGRHYRDRLAPADLADPQLVIESRTALDELTSILDLGSIYDFQLERS